MGKRTVKNYPSPRLVQTIGATNQSFQDAIGELVANCFDARVDENKMHVTIDLQNGKVCVTDDGKGMTGEILEHAVCIGEDMSRYIDRRDDAKGYFGMGFKTSCATLGDYYEIFTRPIDNDIEYHVAFDIADYAQRQAGADAWDIVIEDGPHNISGPLGTAAHGTSFVVSNLHDKMYDGAIKNYIGATFKGHLVTGDAITIVLQDGTPIRCEPADPEFIPGTKCLVDVAIPDLGDAHVTGWMALSKQVNNDGSYGFNIYRRGQLVARWDKSWFKPHLMTSRIIGEVNMDFLESTFYKQGLQENEAWTLVKHTMENYIKPLVSASRNLSRNHNSTKPAAVKEEALKLKKVYQPSSDNPPIVDDSIEPTEVAETGQQVTDKSPRTKTKETISPVVKEESLTLEEGEIRIALQKKDMSADSAPFDYVFDEHDDGQPSDLTVVLYAGHKLWGNFTADIEKVARVLATSDAIYRMLVEKLDYDPRNAQNLRNEWIRSHCEQEA